MDKITQILNVIRKFNMKKESPVNWRFIEFAVKSCVFSGRPITLLSFTCSTINPKFMFDPQNPEYYVRLDPKGNNLEPDLTKLTEFYQALSAVYPTKVIVIIGNTDPFYIYTQEAKKLLITQREFWKRYSKRWDKYKLNLQKYLDKLCPNLNFEVISWYDLEREYAQPSFQKQFRQTLNNLTRYFTNSDLDFELNSLEQAFGKDKYFYNLKCPRRSTLKVWVRRKFAEYAVQGLWIKQLFPSGVLIQNEKPSELRTKMYQPLIKELLDSKLPVIYPYGVDNKGYQ